MGIPLVFIVVAVVALTLVAPILELGYKKITARKTLPDKDGWIKARPGLVSWLFGLLSAGLALLFGVMFLMAVFQPIDDRALFLILGAPLCSLMVIGTYLISIARIKASEHQIAYRGLKGWQYFHWSDVLGINAHAGLGPRLHVQNQRPKYVWPYGYGWPEIEALFSQRGKPFELQ